MKLSLIKQRLIEKNNELPEDERRPSSVREEYKFPFEVNKVIPGELSLYNQSNELSEIDKMKDPTTILKQTSTNGYVNGSNNIDSIKIIGITGSRGKSTTAFLVHKYLESLGYKSILYSSIKIKSPASYINEDEACEIPLQDENTLLNIIEEAEAYNTDFVVLEINETTIEKGLIDGIPFTVRALTNINPNHNVEQYSQEEYVNLKRSFFENVPDDEDCTCVLGLTGSFTREDFNEYLKLNNHPKITYGTKYICELKNADYTNLDCLLYHMDSSIDGLEMKIRVKDKSYNFNTNIILPYNSLNILCAIAILEALGIFDQEAFNKCIYDIQIPGREEVIKINNRTIVIGLSIMPELENFMAYKQNSNINKVKVLTAAIGTGFVSWDKALSSDRYISKRSSVRRFCMDYVKRNADFVYISSNDNAAEDPLTIAQELQGYLNNETPSIIVVDREEAIKRAIRESEPNDLIFISGRGNRRIFCDSANTVKLIQDREVVENVLKDLGW